MTKSLVTIADSLAAEIEAAAAWEYELAEDLARTRKKREDLTTSLIGIARLLPREHADRVRLRLTHLAAKKARAIDPAARVTDKVEAVHRYLARAEDTVATRELQLFLTRNNLATSDKTAAVILSRKAKQGVVTRLARGRYRVNRHHPVIAVQDA